MDRRPEKASPKEPPESRSGFPELYVVLKAVSSVNHKDPEVARPKGAGLHSDEHHAYSQPAHPQAPAAEADAEQGARPEGLPPAPRGLHPRLHHHAQEAALGSA